MTAVTSVWRNAQFRRVWGAGAISTLGGEIGELAIPVLALMTLAASASELSFVRAALLVPFLLLTLWAGVVVDRSRRRPLMIAADLARGVLLALVCWFAVAGWLTIPMLIVAALLLGSFTVVYAMADFAFLPLIVEEQNLLDANARITATQSAIGIAGAGAGGALVQLITAPLALGLNALSYFVSGSLITAVRAEETARGRTEHASAFREARAGIDLLIRHPVLRGLVAEAGVWNFGNEIFTIALTILVLQDYQLGPLILGIVLMSGGLGAVLGSMSSRRLTERFGYGRALIGSLLLGNTAPLIGIAFAGAASATAVIALTLAFLMSGVGIGVANSQAVSIRQLAVPAEVRGRVNAGYRLASWGFLALGALAGGVLVSVTGSWPAAIIGAVIMALASIPVAASPARKVVALDDLAHAAP
ncbi:MFS transporter [Agromyces salentinus]|uniref:MFS transporter n=1 Tax=Agromyces salentinus TaxID=269421 RepID=UPI001478EA4D|nr:MFS transporter [Agromyces salentinus]